MNEMQIKQGHDNVTVFKSELVNGWDIDKQLKRFGLMALYLSMAVDYASDGFFESGWTLAKIADNELGGYLLDSEFYNNLSHAVKVYMTYVKHNDNSEMYYQNLFNQYASKIIEGCKVIKRNSDEHNHPDSWVEMDGVIAPVEVKLSNFDKKALNQLQRYMKAYKSEKGVAVGRNLTIRLPDNIIFVSNDQLDEMDVERKKCDARDKELTDFIKTIKDEYFCNNGQKRSE